jgi:hypothetical protein
VCRAWAEHVWQQDSMKSDSSCTNSDNRIGENDRT